MPKCSSLIRPNSPTRLLAIREGKSCNSWIITNLKPGVEKNEKRALQPGEESASSHFVHCNSQANIPLSRVNRILSPPAQLSQSQPPFLENSDHLVNLAFISILQKAKSLNPDGLKVIWKVCLLPLPIHYDCCVTTNCSQEKKACHPCLSGFCDERFFRSV
jgi:hypothetical protein